MDKTQKNQNLKFLQTNTTLSIVRPLCCVDDMSEHMGLENVDQFFDQSVIKEQLELAVRMAEVVRSTSEWHRRMTSENLSQSGYAVNLSGYPVRYCWVPLLP